VVVESVFTPDQVPGNFATLEVMCQDAEDDFEWDGDIEWATVTNNAPAQLIVYRPEDPVGGGWPVGQFPIVFHHHGNGGQRGDLYEHIAQAVVDDGVIFVSVAGDFGANPDLRAMVDICMLRWLFTVDDWDGDGLGEGGASKLDGNVVVMGHSNGGEGAHIVNNWFEERPWQDDLDAPEQDMRLCGVVGIAPRGAELSSSPFSTGIGIAGDATVPYLTIEGSLDNDVPAGSLWNTSYSGLDEEHTLLDAAKVNVWVYDAEHDSFGGGGTMLSGNTRDGIPLADPRLRGETVVATWTDAFVRRFLFGDASGESILFGQETPASIAVPAWWDYHPAYAGAPLVFVGSEPHQSAAEAELGVRAVVDTMVRSDSLLCAETEIEDGASATSEGTPFFSDNGPLGHCGPTAR
jgi:hypothetical protein